MPPELAVARIRSFLLWLTTLVFAGTMIELLLADHTQETAQFIPFVLCALGLAAVVTVLYRPNRRTIWALRAVMAIVGAGGLLGSTLHLIGNIRFEQEIRPAGAITDAIAAGLKGVNPLFAPGLLVFVALVAVAATYAHPALERVRE